MALFLVPLLLLGCLLRPQTPDISRALRQISIDFTLFSCVTEMGLEIMELTNV